MMWRMAEALLL